MSVESGFIRLSRVGYASCVNKRVNKSRLLAGLRALWSTLGGSWACRPSAQRHVNGQVAVPAGGHQEVPTSRAVRSFRFCSGSPPPQVLSGDEGTATPSSELDRKALWDSGLAAAVCGLTAPPASRTAGESRRWGLRRDPRPP